MSDDIPVRAHPLSRRAFLAVCAPIVAACGRTSAPPPGPGSVTFSLERFPPGVRRTVSIAGRPVEVLRTESGVTARSLLCTHQGCEVAWSETLDGYACPCHEGTFDAEGRPKEGPPPRALLTFPARIEGALLVVDA
jgi:Rieske Fe-S protein